MTIIPQKSDLIQKNVFLDLKKRTPTTAISHIFLLLIFWLSTHSSLQSDVMALTISVSIILISIFRYIYSQFLFQQHQDTWLKYYSAIIFLTSILWSGLIYMSLKNRLELNLSQENNWFILAGLFAAAPFSLGSSKKNFLLFTTILISLPFYFSIKHSQSLIQSFILLLFYAFIVKQWSEFHKNWKQLVEKQDEQKTIIDSFPGGISLIENKKYVQINNTVISHTKIKREDIIGKEVGTFNPDDSLTKLIISFIDSIESSYSHEVKINTPRGLRDHWVLLTRTQSNTVIVITLDVHDLRSTEKELAKQKAKLESTSKMAALGEMASGLAHEINNPLAIISGRVQRLEYELESDENKTIPIDIKKRFLEGLVSINKTANRISAIIKGLRQFARDAENDPFEMYNLTETIKDTLTFCENRFSSKGVSILLKGLDHQITMTGRSTQISQVLLNLLNNSFDAIQELEDRWIELVVFNEEEFVEIRITDSGQGIPIQIQEKLMQPFFTTKETGKGTGLGLSISKSIIETHKGRLFFDHKAKNTTIVMVLPKAINQK